MVQPPKTDQELQCIDCHGVFIFPVRDQIFFEEKGFVWAIRCKPCRLKKKLRFDKKENRESFDAPRPDKASFEESGY